MNIRKKGHRRNFSKMFSARNLIEFIKKDLKGTKMLEYNRFHVICINVQSTHHISISERQFYGH